MKNKKLIDYSQPKHCLTVQISVTPLHLLKINYLCTKQMRAQKYHHQNYIDNRFINTLLPKTCLQYFLKTMTSWKQVKTLSETEGPCPRWGHAMCEINNDIYIFGGYENSKYYNDLWKFSLTTLQFSSIRQSGDIPPPSSNFTMNFYKQKNSIIIFGGGTLNKQKLNTIYQLNLETYSWTKLPFEVQNSQPWQRSYHCSEIIGHFLIVTGGEFFHDLDDLWLYDLRQFKWTEVKINEKDEKPKARKFATSVQYNNRMYLIGGCSGKYECSNDNYYLDFTQFLVTQNIEDLHWTQVKFANTQLIKRWGHGVVIKDDKLFVFGGRQSNKDLQNLIEIDLITSKCREVSIKGNLPKGRRKPGMCLKNNTIFCLSGFDGGYVKDFIQLNLYKQQKTRYQQVQNANNTQSQELGSNNKIQKIVNNDFKNKVKCHLLETKQFLNQIKDASHLVNVKYFKILSSSAFAGEQLEVYRPSSILDSEYENLVEMFKLYLLFGKIYLSDTVTQKENRYLHFLLELSDYYGIEHLKNIIRHTMVSYFEKSLRQKRIELKLLIEDAYYLSIFDQKLGQQAAYDLILRLLKNYEIKLIQDKMKQMEHLIGCKWLSYVLQKYSYEFQQFTLNKEKGQSQNQIPQLINEQNQKLQTTSKASSHFFGLFGAY